MRILLDSHAFLWALMDPLRLTAKVRKELTSAQNEVFVSAVSLWEISLKFSLGKMDLEGISPEKLPDIAKDAGFQLLAMEPDLAGSFHKLPRLAHKDPFDRMLIWQCIQGNFLLVSKDKALSTYHSRGLQLLW